MKTVTNKFSFPKKRNLKRCFLVLASLFFVSFTVYAQQWTPNDPSNIALYKPTKQSSVFEVSSANRAVDGNKDGNWHNRSVTATHGTNNPWWEVDLLGIYKISSITIYNRTDCCPERLNNFTIRVSNQPLKGRNGGQVFNNDRSTFNGNKTFTGNVEGRYISIQLEGNGILSLAEVEVKGEPVSITIDKDTNLALGKSTRQSSVDFFSPSSKANDGDTEGNWNLGSVMHTKNESKPFWEVDLGKNFLVNEVKVFNRTDCCQERLDNYNIYVTDKPVDDIRGRLEEFSWQEGNFLPSTSKSYTGNGFGRYVRIQLNGNGVLNLAEVQVYGRELGELEQNMPETTRYVYRVSAYHNGLNKEWPQSSELATSITEGFDFSKSKESSDTHYWEVSAEVKTKVNILLHEYELTIGAKGGGSYTNTENNSQSASIQESETETTSDQIPVPENSTVYKLVKFKLVEKPFIYSFAGKDYKFRKVLGKSKPVGSATTLVYPFQFDPGFEFDDDERITQANYDKILSKYEQEKKKDENTQTASSSSTNQNNEPTPVTTTTQTNTQTGTQTSTQTDTQTSTDTNSSNSVITRIQYCDAYGTPIGYFSLTEGTWQEHNEEGEVSNEFEETYRDAASIDLSDLYRNGVKIKLDLANKKVWYSDANNDPFELYNISKFN
tara:strand:+ start:37315 stop:39309 length:1995 start_codon:yes stop_codon:yes gene_type:complete